MTPTQTGRPGASVSAAHPDFVTLVVSGGAGLKTQFSVIGVRAYDRTGPVKLR
jgi:hypothetical protein